MTTTASLTVGDFLARDTAFYTRRYFQRLCYVHAIRIQHGSLVTLNLGNINVSFREISLKNMKVYY